MTGYLKLYTCLCSESADHAAWIPNQCQGHFTPVSVEVPNERTGPMTAVHQCGERLCAGGFRTLETPPRRRPAA